MYNPDTNAPECKEIIRPGLCALKPFLPEVRQKVRDKYPMPNARQLRRSQEPIYDTLLQELLEDDYPDTATFLTRLIHLENALHSNLVEGKKMKSLHEVPRLLDELMNCFKLTERMDASKIHKYINLKFQVHLQCNRGS